VKDIYGKRSNDMHNEPCGEGREVLGNNSGIEMNEGWIRDEIWTTEPTPETVQRLIEWFSDEMN
jgi:hypothetical protein